MELEIFKTSGVRSIAPNIRIPVSYTWFGNGVGIDTFQNNSVEKYMTEEFITQQISKNPRIKEILDENNMPLKLNMTELDELKNGHARCTRDVAYEMMNNIPGEFMKYVNVKSIKEASVLHDIGKVLIPLEVLNKKGRLTENEKFVMHKHSELGYELLKNANIDPMTLHLVKYHHQNPSQSGYPKVKKDFFADINLQILNTADKYSALTEKRVYKDGYGVDKALGIIYQDVKSGDLHPIIYRALYKSVKKESVINPFDKNFL